MSIQNLFSSNDFNLFANSITTKSASSTGDLVVTGGLIVDGGTLLRSNLQATSINSAGNIVAVGNLVLDAEIIDSSGLGGTNGQILSSTGTQVKWITAAQKQIFYNSNGNIGTGYLALTGFTSTANNATYIVAAPMILTQLYVTLNAAPTGSGGWTFSLIKNSTVEFVFTINVGSTVGGATGSVPCVQGDTFILTVSSTGSPSTPSATYATIVYQ